MPATITEDLAEGTLTNEHHRIRVVDASGTVEYTFLDVGDFTADGFEDGNREVVALKYRKRFHHLEYGDEKEQSGSFSAAVPKRAILDGTKGHPLQAILADGALTGATTTNPSGAGPMAWKMVVEAIISSTVVSSITFPVTRLMASYSEGGDDTRVSVSFTSYSAPLFDDEVS